MSFPKKAFIPYKGFFIFLSLDNPCPILVEPILHPCKRYSPDLYY